MSFTPLLALGTLVFTFVNFLKACSALVQTGVSRQTLNPVITQLIAWIAGVAGVMIAAHTQFAADISFGRQTLGTMNMWTQVFMGLIATSMLSTINELKKAIDHSDSAKTPGLVTGTNTPTSG